MFATINPGKRVVGCPVEPRMAFVTGGTGFVGSFLIDFLLRKGWRIVALVRGSQPADRLLAALNDAGSDLGSNQITERLRVVAGDISAKGLGLSGDLLEELASEVDEIWHCAASFKTGPQDRVELLAVNVLGTRHVLEFAARCNRSRLVPLNHVSTAFAAPLRDGIGHEVLAPEDAPCRNFYERSKQQAELLVGHDAREHGLPARILRPSIIVGHSQTGKAAGFAAYYDIVRALHLLAGNRNEQAARDGGLRIRIRGDQLFNLVPIDFVLEAMWRLSQARAANGAVFHVVHDIPVAVSTLLANLCSSLELWGVRPVGEDAFRLRPRTRLERYFERLTHFEAAYLETEVRFDNTQFRSVVPVTALPAPEIDNAFLRRINRSFADGDSRP